MFLLHCGLLQVMATKFEVPKDWKAPVHQKDATAESFLKETMATNKCALRSGTARWMAIRLISRPSRPSVAASLCGP